VRSLLCGGADLEAGVVVMKVDTVVLPFIGVVDWERRRSGRGMVTSGGGH
jgi:hypothetical protein